MNNFFDTLLTKRPSLKRMSRDFKLLFTGHKNYTKFIIVGNARTGTTFLQELINSNSQAVCLGELFNPKFRIAPRSVDGYFQNSNVDVLWRNQPIKFLEKDVFRRVSTDIKSVGFKMTYAHAKTENWRNVLPYLIHLKDLKVIHVKRNNKLESYLSTILARTTNVWHDKKGDHADNNQPLLLSLDYQQCLNYFIGVKKIEEEYDIMFQNNDKIEIIYERLSQNYKDEMRLVYDFLDLNYEEQNPTTYKLQKQPLSNTISNYFELKQKFKTTPWYEYFTE